MESHEEPVHEVSKTGQPLREEKTRLRRGCGQHGHQPMHQPEEERAQFQLSLAGIVGTWQFFLVLPCRCGSSSRRYRCCASSPGRRRTPSRSPTRSRRSSAGGPLRKFADTGTRAAVLSARVRSRPSSSAAATAARPPTRCSTRVRGWCRRRTPTCSRPRGGGGGAPPRSAVGDHPGDAFLGFGAACVRGTAHTAGGRRPDLRGGGLTQRASRLAHAYDGARRGGPPMRGARAAGGGGGAASSCSSSAGSAAPAPPRRCARPRSSTPRRARGATRRAARARARARRSRSTARRATTATAGGRRRPRRRRRLATVVAVVGGVGHEDFDDDEDDAAAAAARAASAELLDASARVRAAPPLPAARCGGALVAARALLLRGWGPPDRSFVGARGGWGRAGQRLVPAYEAWAPTCAGGGRHKWVALALLPDGACGAAARAALRRRSRGSTAAARPRSVAARSRSRAAGRRRAVRPREPRATRPISPCASSPAARAATTAATAATRSRGTPASTIRASRAGGRAWPRVPA